ncbi:hypothetical protein [Paenarthrobacter sp. NPDC018779]|uniref:hypothetical protein n=1 Tax=Paenarthrobacter sp. NPDC018779 TaxID=3364375 RepID=UPI0037C70750
MPQMHKHIVGTLVATVVILAGALLVVLVAGISSETGLTGAALVDLEDMANGGFRLGFEASYPAILGVVLTVGLIAAVRALVRVRSLGTRPSA